MMDSTFDAFEANGSIACPLCNKGDWCYLKSNAKGVVYWAVCGRVNDAPDGWERIGTSKGSDRRGIYQLQGISHRRRKFPQDFKLVPQKFEDFPHWKDIRRDADAAIAVGDRVIYDGEIFAVESIGRSHRRQKFTYRLSNGIQTEEELVAHADHDPQTGDTEQATTYQYDSHHKVVRRQWTDRRPWYQGKSKEVRPWHAVRGDDGELIWKLGRGPKDEQWPIYHQDEILEAIASGKPFFVVGGELAAEAMRKLGFCATCCQGGEGRWLDIFEATKETLNEAFSSSRRKPIIILWPDNDPTGETTLSDLHRRLFGELKARACLLNPLELWAEMPAGGDVVDWLKAHQHLKEAEQIQRLQKVVDSAIDRQELRIEAEERAENWGAPTVYKGELGFWRTKKIDDEPVESWNPRCNFDFQILQEISGDDGGGFVLGVRLVDKTGERRCRIMAADCESKSKFQRAISKSLGSPVICKLKDEEVQALLRVRMLEYSQIQGGKTYKLAKRMGCQAENPDGTGTWVFPNAQLTAQGRPTNPDQSGFCWDESINDGGESIKSPIVLPHNPTALKRLTDAAQVFFGDSFPRVLLCMGWGAACVHYSEIMRVYDACPIPNPYGDPGGGKTEAMKCGMALAGNHRAGDASELSRSGLYELLKISGNLPLLLDDPEESDDMNELLKRLYNAKARVVRGDGKRFSSQKPSTSIGLSTNAAIGENQAATQSRLVKVFFPSPIEGGTQNTDTYEALQDAMDGAAAALPSIIQLGLPKDRINELTKRLQPHLTAAHNRIARSFALYLAYAEGVQQLAGCTDLNLLQWVINNICPTLNTLEESGDSVRDFLQKVFNLLGESKLGPWNVKQVSHRDGTKSLAIHVPSVWQVVKSQPGMHVSYNATALRGVLENRGARQGMARFHKDRQTSQDYERALTKLRFEGGSVEAAPKCPETRKKCHIVPMSLIQKYAENNEDMFLEVDKVDSVDSVAESLALPQSTESTFKVDSTNLKVDSVDSDLPENAKKSESTFPRLTQTAESTFSPPQKNGQNTSPQSDTGAESTEFTESPPKKRVAQNFSDPPPPTVTRVGDVVVINASAARLKVGSDRLPLPNQHRYANTKSKLPLDELAQVDRAIWAELQKPVPVIKVKGGRITVEASGLKHCFLADDCRVFRREAIQCQ